MKEVKELKSEKGKVNGASAKIRGICGSYFERDILYWKVYLEASDKLQADNCHFCNEVTKRTSEKAKIDGTFCENQRHLREPF
ncbi:hypothetical protein RM545_04640 [Zunongwangia sp. F260]|uniref:Uncharacterized protein n=1 Tax=Autumnicola lenta TaxID=3075593 RepID=A0ABU3CHZ1_9FLAO|nr:hypothetical protein [Zunongwangia sp. F260]MDT0645968.1 hypothetical protein [Zunongwangia sp. F260]